jgi:hypothetical protein
VCSLKSRAATTKFKIGFIYNRMPIVDELTPFKAYRFNHKGKIVKTMDKIII